MDSVDTSILVFVPNEKGVIPLLKVYQSPKKLLYHTTDCFQVQLEDSDRFAITG